MCSLITDENKRAIAEAQEFEKTSKYNDLVCMKTLEGGIKEKTYKDALERIKKFGNDQDFEMFKTLFENSKPRCCLPKGHKGKCKHKFESFFGELFQLKLSDCSQAPGNDDIFYKNRTSRNFPIQVTKDQYTKLNAKYKWKGNVLLKAGVPLEFASTSYLIATAYFDFAAILMLQKDIVHELPKDIEEKLKERSQQIVEEFENQGIIITDDNGQLCCPVLGCTIEADWYGTDDKSSPNQIQFGHVHPLKSDKYMTRGGNIIPITRNGNLMQSDKTIQQTYADQDSASQLRQKRLKERRLSN